MGTMSRLGRVAALAGVLGLTLPATADDAYNLLEIPGFGGTFTGALGINNAGQVVGYSYTAGNAAQRAFLFDGNMTVDLGTLTGGTYATANGINDLGQVVGSSSSSSGVRAFLYSGGVMTNLGVLGSDTSSSAIGINNSGQIVGQSSNFNGSTGVTRIFLYDGTMMDRGTLDGKPHSRPMGINDSGVFVGVASDTANGIGPLHALKRNLAALDYVADLGGVDSAAQAINESNVIAGYGQTPGGQYHAFVNDAGVVTDLGTFGGSFSISYGINDSGHVVGSAAEADAQSSAFLYTGGPLINLNNLVTLPTGFRLTSAGGINNAGQIIATLSDGSVFRSVILTPIDAPASPVATGSDQSVTVLGDSSGGLSATFEEVSSGGTLSAEYSVIDDSTLATIYAPPTFALPGTQTQMWDIEFTGGFSGDVTLVFRYDETLLPPGVNEQDLRIYHYTGGAWVLLAGQIVDTFFNTITATTPSFSPFVIGLESSVIPEPGMAVMVLLGAAGVWRRPR